jgi:hypothetical protein
MIGYTKEQLLRPAKHLTLMQGSCESRTGKRSCLGCGKPINLNNTLKLCRPCSRKEPDGIRLDRIRRRQSMGKGYRLAPFNPDAPSCFYCVNYRNHSCGFGFPESDANRSFAIECHLFQADARKIEQPAEPLPAVMVSTDGQPPNPI